MRRRKAMAALSAISGLALWEALSQTGILPAALFPPPSRVLPHLLETALSGRLFVHLLPTLRRIASGFVLGAGLGAAAGLSCRHRPTAALIGPWIDALFPIPKVAFIPLAMLLFGSGETMCLALIAVGVALQVAVALRSGMTNIDPSLLDAVRSLGASRVYLLLDVILPSLLPHLIVAMQLGLFSAIQLTVLVEGMFAIRGLGHAIWASGEMMQMESYYANLIVLGLLSFLIASLSRKCLILLTPWHPRGED